MAKSKLSDRQNRQDTYFRKAKKQGYNARAVFKLEEIDQKLHLFNPGDRVLDLGCCPGSWLQYAAKQVGPRGVLVGIDRDELPRTVPEARIMLGDVNEVDPADLLGDLEAFDVVLSDMAPNTIGVRQVDQARSEQLFERALEIAEAVLAPGGSFVGKLFQGPEFHSLITRCRSRFKTVKMVKPKSSRTQSIEQYVTGRGYAQTKDD